MVDPRAGREEAIRGLLLVILGCDRRNSAELETDHDGVLPELLCDCVHFSEEEFDLLLDIVDVSSRLHGIDAVERRALRLSYFRRLLNGWEQAQSEGREGIIGAMAPQMVDDLRIRIAVEEAFL